MIEKTLLFPHLAGLQIAPDKNKESGFAAFISAALQHISLALSTGIIQLSLGKVTKCTLFYQETLSQAL